MEPREESDFSSSSQLIWNTWVHVLRAHNRMVRRKELEFDDLQPCQYRTWKCWGSVFTSLTSACVTSGLNLWSPFPTLIVCVCAAAEDVGVGDKRVESSCAIDDVARHMRRREYASIFLIGEPIVDLYTQNEIWIEIS